MARGIINAVARALGILAAVVILTEPGGMHLAMASPLPGTMPGAMQAGGMHCDACGDGPSAAMAGGACVAPCPGAMLPASVRIVRPSDDGHAPAVAIADRAGTGRAILPDPFPPKLPA